MNDTTKRADPPGPTLDSKVRADADRSSREPLTVSATILLMILLLPAVLAAEALDPGPLRVAVVLTWLLPASQLVHAWYWVGRYRAFARAHLIRAADRPADGDLYTSKMVDLAWMRFAKRVLGASAVGRGGEGARADAVRYFGSAVPNQFPFERGKAKETIKAGGEKIGTAETLFLTPLLYLNLLVLEFYRRRLSLDEATIAGEETPQATASASAFESGNPAELLRLDRYLRRVGEWFRGRLDADNFSSDIFAQAIFYFSHRVERLRQLLAPVGRGGVPGPSEVEFERELESLGVTAPEGLAEAALDAQVSDYTESHHIRSVHPYLIDIASFVPRLITVLVITGLVFARNGISPIGILIASFARSPLRWVGLGGVAIGIVGLGVTASSYSPDLFLRRKDDLPRWIRRARSPRGRAWATLALAVGACASLSMAPGLTLGVPDLAGLIVPMIVAGLMAMEVVSLQVDEISFLAVIRAYHFRPAAVLGSPRLIAFSLLHYATFVVLGTWVGITVAAFLEGQLFAAWSASPPWRMGYPWYDHAAIAAGLLLIAFLLAKGSSVMSRWRVLVLGLAGAALSPVLLCYRPLGGFVIGTIALIMALYLGNHAIFNLTVGLTSVLIEVGRPKRLVWLALAVTGLRLLRGDLPSVGPFHPSFDVAGTLPILLNLAIDVFTLMLLAGVVDPGVGGLVIISAIGGYGFGSWWGSDLFRTGLVYVLTVGVVARAGRFASRFRRAAGHGRVGPADGSFAILWTAGNPIASPALLMGGEGAARRHIELWDSVIAPNAFPGARALLDAGGTPLTRETIADALRFTFECEHARGRSLFGDEAIAVCGPTRGGEENGCRLARRCLDPHSPTCPLTATQRRLGESVDERGNDLNLLCVVGTEEEAERLRIGLRVQRYLVTRVPVGAEKGGVKWGDSQRDTMWYVVALAHALGAAGLSRAARLYVQSNKYRNRRVDEGEGWMADPGPLRALDATSSKRIELEERLALVAYLRATAGVDGEVVHTQTFDSSKSAAQNGNSGAFRDVSSAYILDRNSQSFTLREVIGDIRRLISERDLAGILPVRSTPNIAFPVGAQSDLGEFGFSVFAEALIEHLGGEQGEMVAIGWGNFVALPLNELLRLFADPDVPCRFDPGRSGDARWFGAIHGLLNVPHVSEDFLQIIGTAEGLKSLGRPARLGVTESLHYKLREHSTTLELLAARPRWAGGGDPGQKGRDPLFQRLREFGTDSVFMREIQKDRGRYYTLAPVAMAYILMIPLLVMTGYSPFVGISVLFLVGLMSNQALTLNSLGAWLRRAGLRGGSAIWLSQRLRDALIFPPLLFIEMWGVVEALVKGPAYPLVFKLSGGSRMDEYGSSLARTIVGDVPTYRVIRAMFLTGLIGTFVNGFAIANLDLLNVLMLYPMLIFTLGLTFGAFVYRNQRGPGKSPLGVLRWGPKVLGVAVGLAVVTAFALGNGVARGTDLLTDTGGRIFGVPSYTLLLAASGAILFTILPLRTVLVPNDSGKYAKSHNRSILVAWVVTLAAACAAAGYGAATPLQRALDAFAVGAIGFARLFTVLLIRLVKGPSALSTLPRPNYTRDTVTRSALITASALIWFALVPVPALISFQVMQYQVVLLPGQLKTYFAAAAGAIGLVILVGWLSLALGWPLLYRRHRRLHARYRLCVGRGVVEPAMVATIEAALEGFRVAADTRSPVLASGCLETVATALDFGNAPFAYFAPGRRRRPFAHVRSSGIFGFMRRTADAGRSGPQTR